jgi:hypothetical protein
MQDGAKAHITYYSMNVLNEVFEDRLINCRLWSARAPDLNPYNFYLWGNLENKVHSNSLQTLYELKHNICETIHLSRSVSSN